MANNDVMTAGSIIKEIFGENYDKKRMNDLFLFLSNIGVIVADNDKNESFVIPKANQEAVKTKLNALKNVYSFRNDLEEKTKNNQKAILNNYDKMIKEYVTLLEKMQVDSPQKIALNNLDLSKLSEELAKLKPEDFREDYKDEYQKIVDAIKDVSTKKTEYKAVIDGIDVTKDNLGFDENLLSAIDKKQINSSNQGLHDVNEEIAALEAEVKKLNENATLKFRKRRVAKRKNRLNNRIQKLKQRKGKLEATQKRIVNKNSAKYRAIKEKEIRALMQEQSNNNAYVNAMLGNETMRKGLAKDKENNEAEINSLVGKTDLRSRIDRFNLGREQRKIERQQSRMQKQMERIKGLKNKRGSTILSEQIFVQYAKLYGM